MTPDEARKTLKEHVKAITPGTKERCVCGQSWPCGPRWVAAYVIADAMAKAAGDD